MKNNYIEWLKDNWQKSAILVLIYVLGSIIPLYLRIDLIEFMLLLAFPLYLVHEIEEYILPGGFTEFFNENLLKVNPEDKIVPIDREVVFWINMIYIWVVIPLFSGLGFYNIMFAAWIPYFFFFQALSHFGMGIKEKMILNPGIRSSFILHVPYAIIMINLLSKNEVLINPYINMHMFIGFMFNLLLPIFAKYIIMPRYHRRLNC
ncbi:MAG: HXXEE domain-containing protein [Bacillota bacterium]|nr:HXXEE domain-containing protein [Bacillota bacterium]